MYGQPISLLGNSQADKSKKSDVSKKFKTESVSKPEDTSFINILESIIPSSQENTKDLNELWRHIPELEKEFLKTPSYENLEKYKAHIKTITEIVLQKNHKLVQARQRGRTDKKILMSVKIVDEKLQILTLTMLSPNNSAFNLLKQMEEIRGLLMDMMQ